MLWTVMAVTLLVGLVVLLVVSVVMAKRPASLDQLGSVSARWIAEHCIDIDIDLPSASLR